MEIMYSDVYSAQLAPSISPSNLEMKDMSTWTYLEHHSHRTPCSNIPNLPRQFFTNLWGGFNKDDFPCTQFTFLGSGKLSEMMKAVLLECSS